MSERQAWQSQALFLCMNVVFRQLRHILGSIINVWHGEWSNQMQWIPLQLACFMIYPACMNLTYSKFKCLHQTRFDLVTSIPFLEQASSESQAVSKSLSVVGSFPLTLEIMFCWSLKFIQGGKEGMQHTKLAVHIQKSLCITLPVGIFSVVWSCKARSLKRMWPILEGSLIAVHIDFIQN